jgi:hypothetical protein
MSAVPTRPCPKCQRRLIGRFTTFNGQLVEEWPRCWTPKSTDELRDALAALYADGGQGGCEHAADELHCCHEAAASEVVMDARFKVREESLEFFLEEWEDENSEWEPLQRIRAALAAIAAGQG